MTRTPDGRRAADNDLPGTAAMSGDRSSALRKRALRQLSREQPVDYSTLYEQVLSETSDPSRHRVRGRAPTRLRREFPDRYLELFALEQSGTGTDVPPDIRSKSWQRASARLADLRKAAHQSRFAEFRAQGMTPAKAYERAIAAIRAGDADLFARLLAEEYRLWLTASFQPHQSAIACLPAANAHPRPPRRPPADAPLPSAGHAGDPDRRAA